MRRAAFVCLAAALAGAPASAQVRIASLAPSLTELAFDLGLGGRLVARSSACDAPPGALSLPVAGPFGQPNIESLHALRPDVVLFTDLERPGLVQTLDGLGIRSRVLPCTTWPQLMDAARAIAGEAGEPEKGLAWVARMEERRAALEARVASAWQGRTRPSVYVELWGDPLTSAGRASLLDDLVTLAGGRNLGAAMESPYPQVSAEWVLRENPDVILLAYMLQQATPAVDALRRRPGWGALRAIRDARICSGIPPDLLLRPGPRWIEGAERFADYLSTSGAAATR